MRRHVTVWKRLLVFRDYLRSHPDVAAEYAALKRSVAGTHNDDRHAYMSAKGEFIERVTATAMREP
jgi:GrpB-like predicted nucleotidyltransferase (UPF0157 family)